MKTITIKQPWATLIVEGIKDVENRTWPCPTKYIGHRVLVHASAKPVSNFKLLSYLTDDMIKESESVYRNGNFTYGAIIGSVEIVDCVVNHESIWAEQTAVFDDIFIGTTYNWVLANPIKFPEPIPAKGKLSFWDYPLINE